MLWAFAVPLTGVTILSWLFWQRISLSKEVVGEARQSSRFEGSLKLGRNGGLIG
jgi:hypothetical protein